MAAPKGKGGGGGGAAGKKAKTAQKKEFESLEDKGQFRIATVLELVSEGGKEAAIVQLDEKGTKGVVDAIFVLKGADGSLKPREVACPAVYDAVAQQKAIARLAALG